MKTKRSTPANGTRRRRNNEDRRNEIIRVSENLFAERGFSGTSIDAIAERAKCSKSAIYELFGSKASLLRELTLNISENLNEEVTRLDENELPIREFLETYVRDALTVVVSPRHVGVVRAVFAEAPKIERLGKDFYEVGPKAGQDGLAKSLQRHANAGQLEFESARTAAVHLYGLMLWGTMMPMLTGARKRIAKTEIEKVTHETVDAFLKIYAAPPRGKKTKKTATRPPRR